MSSSGIGSAGSGVPSERKRHAEAARPYAKALVVYLTSRVVVVLGVLFGKIYIPLGNDSWNAGPRWYHSLLRWDSEWYAAIATQLYAFNGDAGERQTVVFYPLYPLLSRAVAAMTGLAAIDAMLVVANVAALVAVLLIFKIARDVYDETVAMFSVALLGFYPGSIFLSAGYTEPVILLWIGGFFLALRDKRFVLAAGFAGLASATRSSGIVLLPVLLWGAWRVLPLRAFSIRALPLAAVASAGLWLYVIYLAYAFGRPFAFSEAQAAFHDNTTMMSRIVSAVLLKPFGTLNLGEASPAGLDHWFTLIFIVLIVRAFFVLDSTMALFAAGVLLLPYLTLSGGPAGLTSMTRFNVVSFPLFIVAAEFATRVTWLLPGVIGILGGLLLMYAALFSQWQWVG